MADLKISQLTSATTPLAGTELVAIVQSSTTKKVAASAFSAYGPAFRAESASNQNINNGTWTKVTLGTETFDTNSNFASSTFTPTIAGYYQINLLVQINTANFPAAARLYKNGAGGTYAVGGYQIGALNGTTSHSELIFMNGTTDYLEMYALQSSGGSTNLLAGFCVFSAVFVRGA
jgi:hypothetical protein